MHDSAAYLHISSKQSKKRNILSLSGENPMLSFEREYNTIG